MTMKTCILVAHDAGGAEVLSSWAKRHPEYHYQYILKGPALKIFQAKNGDLFSEDISSIEKLTTTDVFVLTGTGYASSLERDAIASAKRKHIRVISFLDHWCHYNERFLNHGKIDLPDEIWVGDNYAFQIAVEMFPKESIRLVPNPYFLDIQDYLSEIPIPKDTHDLRILYVTEPLMEFAKKQYGDANYWGYTEFEAMNSFFDCLPSQANKNKIESIRIRRHPSEDSNKYLDIVSKFSSLPVTFSQNRTLIEDCCWADWVVGCQTMALVVGLMAKKKVFSSIPKGGKFCVLPHKEIIHLFNPPKP